MYQPCTSTSGKPAVNSGEPRSLGNQAVSRPKAALPGTGETFGPHNPKVAGSNPAPATR